VIVLFAGFLTLESSFSASGKLSELESSTPGQERVRQALGVLTRLPSGRRLIERLEKKLQAGNSIELMKWIQPGAVSKTDAVLTRHFNPISGEEIRERKIMIYLRTDQPLNDLVLDLAHEMTHASEGTQWDPYDPTLTPGRYIQNSIDGVGGEVDALTQECQVGVELNALYGIPASRCLRYTKGQAVVVRDRIRRDFYRVGRWYSDLKRRLGSESRKLPLLSRENPQLYSSTGQTPYPVALLAEFRELNDAACANSRKRLRDLATVSSKKFLHARCSEK
jgi:hypothetical protein